MLDPIEALRFNIRKLKPDGETGFEGLIAAVLGELTGRGFALASEGSQRGRDGQSAQDGGAIVFEAKRYDESIPKDKIFTKILEIAAEKSNVIELYIVPATCAISAQHITTTTLGACRSRCWWRAGQQSFRALRQNHSELREKATRSVVGRCSFLDKSLSRPMRAKRGLLMLVLERHETHAGSRHSLANSRSIRCVILAALAGHPIWMTSFGAISIGAISFVVWPFR